jgi:hypothetical protein
MPKYGNKKTIVGCMIFDSKREASRWGDLLLLERAGHIQELKRQVKYELAPSVKFEGAKRAQPPLRLIVDFAYIEGGARVLEDVKGVVTTAFTIKRHLLKHLTGLDVRVTK